MFSTLNPGSFISDYTCYLLGALGVFGVLTTDFLFYNKHNLHKSLRERFVDVDYLIDISSNLSEPKVVSYCPTTTDLISNLLEQIQHNKGKFNDLYNHGNKNCGIGSLGLLVTLWGSAR